LEELKAYEERKKEAVNEDGDIFQFDRQRIHRDSID
jgi:hypothetical protein